MATALLRPFPTCPDGVAAAVTTRHGGVSAGPYATLNLGLHVGDDPAAVLENRRRTCAALGVEHLTIADQQHGARVAPVDASNAGAGFASLEDAVQRLPATDALVTATSGVGLCVLVADCAPVVLVDPVRRVLAVAHSGRAGTVLGVVPAAVEAMRRWHGCEPGDLWAGVGPHVATAGYEVGPAEVLATREAFPDVDVVTDTRDGRGCVDLGRAIHHQLVGAGVDPGRVERMGEDTRTGTGTWFSDRAARPCGRFGLVAVLR